MTAWYLRSMGDGDTHTGTYSVTAGSVRALCGVRFRPLMRTDAKPITLGSPPDPEQVCLDCRHARRSAR